MTCSNCGSNRIEKGVSIGKTAEAGNVGPRLSKGIFMNVSQMYCDLCLDCGELLRFYIKDDTDKKWNKKPGSLGSK